MVENILIQLDSIISSASDVVYTSAGGRDVVFEGSKAIEYTAPPTLGSNVIIDEDFVAGSAVDTISRRSNSKRTSKSGGDRNRSYRRGTGLPVIVEAALDSSDSWGVDNNKTKNTFFSKWHTNGKTSSSSSSSSSNNNNNNNNKNSKDDALGKGGSAASPHLSDAAGSRVDLLRKGLQGAAEGRRQMPAEFWSAAKEETEIAFDDAEGGGNAGDGNSRQQ